MNGSTFPGAVSIVTPDATVKIPMAELVDLEAERARLTKEAEAVQKAAGQRAGPAEQRGLYLKAPANVADRPGQCRPAGGEAPPAGRELAAAVALSQKVTIRAPEKRRFPGRPVRSQFSGIKRIPGSGVTLAPICCMIERRRNDYSAVLTIERREKTLWRQRKSRRRKSLPPNPKRPPAVSRPAPKREENAARSRAKRQAAAVIRFAAAVLLLCLALIPGASLWGMLHNLILGMFGLCAYILPVLLIYIAVATAADKPAGSVGSKLWQCGVLMVLGTAAVQVFSADVTGGFFAALMDSYAAGGRSSGGGDFGAMIGYPMEYFFHRHRGENYPAAADFRVSDADDGHHHPDPVPRHLEAGEEDQGNH